MVSMEKHFVVTVYIIHKGKALLHPHQKLQKWLPPGGHIEKNETPIEAALREVEEECNLAIEFIGDEPFSLDYEVAKSFPTPYLCLLENIPPYKETPAHQHIDLIYIARPTVEKEPLTPFEWVDFERVERLNNEGLLFLDTYKILSEFLTPCEVK